jgi:aspartyl aminopeptidase
MTHDLTSQVWGDQGEGFEFVSAPRLDNQATCYAGLEALLAATRGAAGVVPVLALFDHEEVGSQSDHGAQSELLITVLERIVLAAGTVARSSCAASPGRWWPPGTWPTPLIRIPTGTSPAT